MLADPMTAVDGMGFHRRVPPRVVQDHGIGVGEIEPGKLGSVQYRHCSQALDRAQRHARGRNRLPPGHREPWLEALWLANHRPSESELRPRPWPRWRCGRRAASSKLRPHAGAAYPRRRPRSKRRPALPNTVAGRPGTVHFSSSEGVQAVAGASRGFACLSSGPFDDRCQRHRC